MNSLKKTVLFEKHKKLGAKIVDFAGFEMPVKYSGILGEHKAVRESAGVFDVSHMGEIEVSGPKALEYCQNISTNDVSKLKIGQVQYSCYCMPSGGVVDDFTLFRTDENKYLFIVNAANKQKDLDWMIKHKIDGANIRDLSEKFSLIALQGPNSENIASKIFGKDIREIKFYSFVEKEFSGKKVSLSRTGYTGENGFEIMIENDFACELWDKLMEYGKDFNIVAVGLGARDTLRMEMGYALYGHELTENISPLQANLGWIVKLKKDKFIGREALLKQKADGIKKRFTGFKLTERGVPREKFLVFKDEKEIGWVSSGTHSPSLGTGLGLCFVNSEISDGENVFIEIRDKRVGAILQKPPFVKGSIKR